VLRYRSQVVSERTDHRAVRRRAQRFRPRPRAAAAAVLAVVLVAGPACSSDSGSEERLPFGLDGPAVSAPTAGPPVTIPGGVDLPRRDPASVLVGPGLAFGSQLPSATAGLAELEATEEVRSTLGRRVYDQGSARLLAELSVLVLDGTAFHDERTLERWVVSFVGRLAGSEPRRARIEGRPIVRAGAGGRAVLGLRRGSLLVLVSGARDETDWVAALMLQGLRTDDPPRPWPATPLAFMAADVPFVPVPGVEFVPFPPAEDEPPPAPPVLAGTLATEGRIAVVGGERRATVWSLATDPGVYATAEELAAAIDALVGSRTGGSTSITELGDRLVTAADGPPGGTSTRAFHHGNVVVLVEGRDPAQLDAVATAWVRAL
jgi:hypothetical protein